ncbi:MAG: hypothetical protein ACLSDQ_03275 [Adlercreutzia equolifaciens]
MGEDIIKHNPMLKEPILTVLALAEEAGDRATLEATALQVWKPSFSRAPAAVIDTLVRHGFLPAVLRERRALRGHPGGHAAGRVGAR